MQHGQNGVILFQIHYTFTKNPVSMSYTNRSLSILLLALVSMVLWGCSKGISPDATTPVTAISPDNRLTFNTSFGGDMSYNAVNLTLYINAKFKVDGINASF